MKLLYGMELRLFIGIGILEALVPFDTSCIWFLSLIIQNLLGLAW
jgi:hypothetical protein